MISFARNRYGSLILKCVVISSLVIAGCKFISPGIKTPLPRDNRVKKSFFANFDADGNIAGHRTFIGGWMAETTAGKQSYRISNHIEYAGHCNIEFHVRKMDQDRYHLVGLRVNPSFPYDRDRWEPVITIPITKQYYYRKRKDQFERETNEYIEDDSEDDPSRRPYMNLDLAGIHIHDWSMAIFGLESVQGGHRIESIEDFESAISEVGIKFHVDRIPIIDMVKAELKDDLKPILEYYLKSYIKKITSKVGKTTNVEPSEYYGKYSGTTKGFKCTICNKFYFHKENAIWCSHESLKIGDNNGK